MITETRQGRDLAVPTSTKQLLSSNSIDTVTRPEALPRARTQVGPPCPGRRLTIASVERCPVAGCEAMHTHRVRDLGALLRRKVIRICPATREKYLLVPIRKRRPKATSAGEA